MVQGFSPVYDFASRFWLRFQYGYAGKHGSESSSAASPKTTLKNIANTSKPVLGGGWRRIEIVSNSYQNRIEIVSTSYPNRMITVSKPHPNRNKIINRKDIVRKS